MQTSLLLAGLTATLCAQLAWADPGDSILTNYAENGLRQFDFKIGTFTQKGQASEDTSTLGLGYGLTDYWFSELYLGYAKSGGESIKYDASSLQNTFLLSGSDSLVDLGLYTEIEFQHDRSAGDKFSFGPLTQVEFGLTRVNFNLLFRRSYYVNFSNPMQMGYQWQIKQHIQAPFDIGLQGFGELGRWDHWAPKDQQSHQIGPALFGKVALGDDQMIAYNAAILFDVWDDIHATTFRFQAVLGF
ncbi:hypothetical protein AAKU67_001513 [Oxalobacteraceae bacterium GrIS 2.11]